LLASGLIAPAVIGFALFFAYPTIRGVYLSFTRYRVLSPPQWTGLDNYAELAQDSVFWRSLGVTLLFVALAATATIALALVTAVILHRLGTSTLTRGLVLIPFLISNVVAGIVFKWLLDPQLGIVNALIEGLGGDRVLFFTDATLVIPSIALITTWKGLGYTAILLFAGLQTIPPTVYEAARLDGAGEVRIFFRVTLPLLRPVLAMVVVLTMINEFQIFDLVQVTTRGGPANASLVLQAYIYREGFGQFNFGYACAIAVALFALMIAISTVQMRLMRINEADTD
jgi:multiple sugar transport system permease protein